jgi:uridine kinase
MNSCIRQVVKRDGTVVPFNRERITNAIYRAAVAVGGRNREIAEDLTDEVVDVLERACGAHKIPTVEEIQDIVEKVLIERGHARTAKAYILYRQDRARRRERRQKGKSQRDPENIPYRKLWEILNWAVDRNVHNIYQLQQY